MIDFALYFHIWGKSWHDDFLVHPNGGHGKGIIVGSEVILELSVILDEVLQHLWRILNWWELDFAIVTTLSWRV